MTKSTATKSTATKSTAQKATKKATKSSIFRMSLKTVEEHTDSKSNALSSIIAEANTKKEQTDDKHLLKELSDQVHNASARKKRLAKFTKMSTKAQSYIFKNAKDHKATILETSSIYAFDTLLTFVQAITDNKVVNRECFYVFFTLFAKNRTVSARDIQRAIQNKCISQTTKSNFTAESARTWTRNCFHAMHALSAMSEEKLCNEIFYTINVDAQFTKDLMKETALLPSIASDDKELNEAVNLELAK